MLDLSLKFPNTSIPAMLKIKENLLSDLESPKRNGTSDNNVLASNFFNNLKLDILLISLIE